jgi:beta-glucanase (GH16 family)
MRSRAATGSGPPRRVRWVLPVLLAVAFGGCGPASPSAPRTTGSPEAVVSAGPSAPPPAAATGGTPIPATMAPSEAPTLTPPPVPSSDPSTWPLVWSDEFDGPAGSPPDPATWGYDLGDGSAAGLQGWGNKELETYTDSTANAAVDGKGNLVLRVRKPDAAATCWYGPCRYTSARLVTRGKREFQYGRLDVRFKVTDGFGVWPAIWLLGTDVAQVGWPQSGEIDLMEFVGRRPNEVLVTAHGPGYSGSSGKTTAIDLGGPVSAGFHTVTVDWWPGRLSWLFDGRLYQTVTAADVAPNAWVFDHPFYLLVNVAVGGTLGGQVDPNLPLPQSMVLDYVRLYQESPS